MLTYINRKVDRKKVDRKKVDRKKVDCKKVLPVLRKLTSHWFKRKSIQILSDKLAWLFFRYVALLGK